MTHDLDLAGRCVEIDLAGDYLRQNFATILAEWAKMPPIYVRVGDAQQVVCNRYADVMEVFRDRDRFSVEPPDKTPGAFDRFLGLEALSQLDGARHDRLRRLMSPTFNPKNVSKQGQAIERVVREMVDAIVATDGIFDAMNDFAMHLVIRVLLGEMLRMDAKQIGAFVAAGEAIGAVSQLRPGQTVPNDTVGAFRAARATVEALIAERRVQPGDDLISTLIGARDNGDKLTDMELFDQIFIICAAALTTTAGSLGGLLLLLGRNEDQFEKLKLDLTRIPAAVEEGLRVHGPGYLAFARFALTDTVVGGTPIPRGTPVFCSFQAACYDPDMYPEPLRFDIDRNPRAIMIFGAGTHHCLGQVLARSIIQISVRLLLERFPKLALADKDFSPRYHGEFGEALIVELPMKVS